MSTWHAHRGRDLAATVRSLVSMGMAAHAVAPRMHAALSQALPFRRSRADDATDSLMREAAHALVSRVPEGADRELILWIVDTVSHAVIHSGVVERPDDVMSGRLGEELILLLVAYLRAPRS